MNDISINIGQWYDANRRELPWRQTRDPYRIWLSEIILQQTRVAQGMDYYVRFVEAFPTVEALAAAPLDRVLKLWQGLGYYSRARNLHAAAQCVCADHCTEGVVHFPTAYAELIKLKGVGRYTAAAIASFSADEAVAVVDGNVYRVLSRLFDVETPIDTTAGQKYFQALADELMRQTVTGRGELCRPSHHNQALMEFGALHCTPASPRCDLCPVSAHCLASAHSTVEQRPVKQGKVKVRERRLIYIIYIYKETLWVHQRGKGDIWEGLWEPVVTLAQPRMIPEGAVLLMNKRHQLTHQTLFAEFWVVRLADDEDPALNHNIQALPADYRQVTWMEWQQLAVPRLIEEANKKLSAWF